MDLLTLALIGLVGGLITGISPCILPVLPVVFFAGGVEGRARTTDRQGGDPTTKGAAGSVGAMAQPSFLSGRDDLDARRRRDPGGTDQPTSRDRASARRPYLVILGLVTSFTLVTLVGTVLLNLLGLPQDLLRWAGIAVLALLGVGLLVPQVRGGPGAAVPAADAEARTRRRTRRVRAGPRARRRLRAVRGPGARGDHGRRRDRAPSASARSS